MGSALDCPSPAALWKTLYGMATWKWVESHDFEAVQHVSGFCEPK